MPLFLNFLVELFTAHVRLKRTIWVVLSKHLIMTYGFINVYSYDLIMFHLCFTSEKNPTAAGQGLQLAEN